MKFKLIINRDDDEEIIAKVHSASKLTAEIENIVLSYIGNDGLTVHGDYELTTLKFQELYNRIFPIYILV